MLYGPEPEWVEINENGWIGVRAVCTAPDHSLVPLGGQCRCGMLNVGSEPGVEGDPHPR